MREFFVKTKIVFDRGKNWVSYLTFLMLIFVTITAMKEYPYFSFLSSWYWLAVFLLGSLAVVGFLGWLEMKGLRTWQKEREIYGRMDPVMNRLIENQEEILKKLNRLER